jgi:hypothetical protein
MKLIMMWSPFKNKLVVSVAVKYQGQKQKGREKSFVETWLERSEFKNWLQAKRDRHGKHKPFCKICSKTITCSKTGLQRHLKSKSHENKVAALG